MPEKKKIYPRKKKLTREKIGKSARENFKLPEKNFKKVGEKIISSREKNQKKCQKTFSRALFIFSGNKKHCVSVVNFGEKKTYRKDI